MNVFLCEDGTIINMDKFIFISGFYNPESVENGEWTVRIQFSADYEYLDLAFHKEVDRDNQYAKIASFLSKIAKNIG